MSEGAGRQATLQMTGEQHIDEHGLHDRRNRGGVYDATGEFDLDATESLLADRFEPYREQLPDRVGRFRKRDAPRPSKAVYVADEQFETTTGVTVIQRELRIRPVGPHLNSWTVVIEDRSPKHAIGERTGWSCWHHPHASKRDCIGTAIATALAVMRGEVPARPNRGETA